MLTVIENKSRFDGSLDKGAVVIESDHGGPPFTAAFEELGVGMAARHLAIQYATHKGMSPAHINGNLIGPYPVNRAGEGMDEVFHPTTKEPLEQTHPRMQPYRYRVEIPVCRPG